MFTSTPSRAASRDHPATGSARSGHLESVEEDLVDASRARLSDPLRGQDRWVSVISGALFLVTALTMAVLAPGRAFGSPAAAALFVVVFALASRVEFEVGPGTTVPTQLVFIPMLFGLPAPVVPMVVASGYLLGAFWDFATGRMHIQRSWVLLASSWYSVGPALVFALAGSSTPRPADWGIYLLALTSQFAFDCASSTLREWRAFGTPPKAMLSFLLWIYCVDCLLFPIGLMVAIAATRVELAVLLVVPLIGLLGLLARDRQARIDRAISFKQMATDTERKLLEKEQLLALEEQLRHAQRLESIGHLAGGIAHEFNNLLAVIVNYTKFVMDDLDEYDPRRPDLIQVLEAADRATNLVRQLLRFSRKDIVSHRDTDINQQIREMSDFLRTAAGAENDLQTRLDTGVPAAFIDPSSFEQFLTNLVANAREAMPDGGTIVIETSSGPCENIKDRHACISVTDTGVGMSEEIIQQIFDPFFSTRGRSEATGLGLAAAYGIVTQAQGCITVESHVGEGSTFKVCLSGRSDGDQTPVTSGRRNARLPA
jgi:signal transduction histidine kinase